MHALIASYHSFHNALFGRLRHIDGLAPLALRIYLAPVFWMAGTQKLCGMDGTIAWFGSLGLPYPALMAWLAACTEAAGALLLAVGLATRWISLPLMVTMLVAAFAVHWEHGWYAIADSGGEGVAERLERAREILREYGNYGWLTEKGRFVILNNGVEFAITYLAMLVSLFFMGGGRYVSVDYWLARATAGESQPR